MEQFLNKLYSYEYFGTYLMISIIVLILLFIIILFFGKKDQKKREIEETKKLQQINNEENTFKEDSLENKVEIENNTENVEEKEVLEDTIVVPNVENLEINENLNEESLNTEDPIMETLTNNVENTFDKPLDIPEILEEDNTDLVTVIPEVDLNDVEINEPILDKIEEKPIIFDNFVNNEEQNKLPEFNFDDIVENIGTVENENVEVNNEVNNIEESVKSPEIFSSVFVDDKKEEINYDDDLDFELPTLKKEVQEEQKKGLDMPSINDLSGETYHINE